MFFAISTCTISVNIVFIYVSFPSSLFSTLQTLYCCLFDVVMALKYFNKKISTMESGSKKGSHLITIIAASIGAAATLGAAVIGTNPPLREQIVYFFGIQKEPIPVPIPTPSPVAKPKIPEQKDIIAYSAAKKNMTVKFYPVTGNNYSYNEKISIQNTSSVPIYIALNSDPGPILIDDRNQNCTFLEVRGIERHTMFEGGRELDERYYAKIEPGESYDISMNFSVQQPPAKSMSWVSIPFSFVSLNDNQVEKINIPGKSYIQ